MLSDAQLEAYREMKPEERWREVEALMSFAWRFLKELPDEEVERRLAHDRDRHDESDAIILDHLQIHPLASVLTGTMPVQDGAKSRLKCRRIHVVKLDKR